MNSVPIVPAAKESLYAPLDKTTAEIRLLKLLPGNSPDEALHCTLYKTSLKDIKHEYYALSYVWGDARITENIIVNGQSVAATTNLVSFLRHLAVWLQDSPIEYLWVDAVCINQADIQERNHQVTLMASIYKTASRTLSWLGLPTKDSIIKDNSSRKARSPTPPEEENGIISRPIALGRPRNDSSNALEVIRAFAKEIQDSDDDSDVSWLKKYPEACQTTHMPHGVQTNDVWESVGHLLNRNYWNRVWIFQELVLGKDVLLLCGSDSCTLEELMSVARWLSIREESHRPPYVDDGIWVLLVTKFWYDQLGFNSPLRIFTSRKNIQDKRDLAWNWKDSMACLNLQATDPRDKIYGALAVTTLPITVDYERSIWDLFYEYTDIGVKCNCLHDVFEVSGVGRYESYIEGRQLPSWVPDWNLNLDGSGSIRNLGNAIGACGISTINDATEYRPTSSDGVLHVTGVHCRKVLRVDPIAYNPEDMHVLPICIAHLLHTYLSMGADRDRSTGMMMFRALICTLMRESHRSLFKTAEDTERFNQFTSGLLHMLYYYVHDVEVEPIGVSYKDKKGDVHGKLYGDQEEGNHFFRDKSSKDIFTIGMQTGRTTIESLAKLHGWALFQAEGGSLGICPFGTKPGDHVYVVLGSKVPVILHKQGSWYSHVGSCFALGLMDGEAILEVEAGKRALEHIEIH